MRGAFSRGHGALDGHHETGALAGLGGCQRGGPRRWPVMAEGGKDVWKKYSWLI